MQPVFYTGKVELLIIFTLLIMFLSGCNAKPKSENITDGKNEVIALVDFYHSEEMPWDENIDIEIPEFPNIIFRWNSEKLIGIKDGVETGLIEGMPLWNVFATELNGDNFPELCATVSTGSGIVDDSVIVLDYANNKYYVVSDRMVFDYHLSKKDNKLIITRKPYNEKEGSAITGGLSIVNSQLVVEY